MCAVWKGCKASGILAFMTDALRSLAIAGAWGYIGHKFIEAGLDLGLDVYAFDPGPAPTDVDLTRVHRVESPAEFYRLDADLYHLALHPQHRSLALASLLPRAANDGIVILNEKPMAAPDRPRDSRRLLADIDGAGATVFFDFPEIFDPLTHHILNFLNEFEDVRIAEIHIQRSKDREAKNNPRNLKRMVHIQYQESVHCLAFVLNLLGHIHGEVETTLDRGLVLSATAEPYDPPNPDAYPHVVDGRCNFDMTIGETAIHGHTDFKRHAPWRKQRVIRGTGDGTSFEIDVDYLEGAKYLRIDGQDQRVDPAGSSYEAVLLGIQKWHREVPPTNLMRGVYPNPDFALLTYQLSSALWRASYDREKIHLPDSSALRAFDAGFEETEFARYV